jgi:16S rRNA (cytosine1402-N4)-methyltransferase
MRLGDDDGLTADALVNGWDEGRLAGVIRRYGEDPHAGRIAAAIVRARPVRDTLELAGIIAAAVPAHARRGAHPARRTFQALRIAVNDELGALTAGLEDALSLLQAGGRVAVISYHSLEDRIVKRRFAAGATGCICPPDLPVCGCGRTAALRLVTRHPVVPGEAEVAANPRARSARLRVAEKVAP